MTTYNADSYNLTSIASLTYVDCVQEGVSEKFNLDSNFFTEALQEGYCEPPILMTLLGSGINPIPFYFLAMFDSLGVRRYWIDAYPSINNAPTLMVGTYDTSSFVILGRY